MLENINNWREFNNITVKVKINKKNFNAVLLVEKNMLLLRIDMINDIVEFRNHIQNPTKKLDLIPAKVLYNNLAMTFLNCLFSGCSSGGVDCIKEATIDYRVDRVLVGVRLTKSEYRKIGHYEVKYNNIDSFTDNKPYSMNYETFEYKAKSNNYKINLKNSVISVMFSSCVTHCSNSLSIMRNTCVDFNHKKKINVVQMLDNIYMFRNFLMILLKRGVVVEKQFIYLDDEKYQVVDCRDDDLVEIGENLEEHLNHRCLKIEKITNLEELYQRFINNYDSLLPFLELYYNVTQFSVPNLTRFVNAITMLENYCRTFSFDSALSLTKQTKPKKDDAEYKDMVKSLINNVNVIYNFTLDEIECIADNIKNARVYYIHYKVKTTSKKLSNHEQFCYSYFIQDVLLLNLYKLLNMDITVIDNINFLDFYYEKEDLL